MTKEHKESKKENINVQCYECKTKEQKEYKLRSQRRTIRIMCNAINVKGVWTFDM